MPPRYSVIIPACNERRLPGRLIDSIDVARSAYGHPGAIEVIVADNVSTDRTSDIATDRGCRVVVVDFLLLAVEGLRGPLKRDATPFADKYGYKPNR